MCQKKDHLKTSDITNTICQNTYPIFAIYEYALHMYYLNINNMEKLKNNLFMS